MYNSSKRLQAFAGFALAVVISTDLMSSQTNVTENINMKSISSQIDQAIGQLTEFNNNKSIDQLENAKMTMERIVYPDTTAQMPARQQLARMWLKLLATIDQNINTNFDVKDIKNYPTLTVIPPPSGGMRLQSGADPEAIKNPAAHAEYIAALKQNQETAEKMNYQLGLRRIDQTASLDVERFFKTIYTTSVADQKELDDILNQSALSVSRKQKIKALFDEK
jgi:hypothetical protein